MITETSNGYVNDRVNVSSFPIEEISLNEINLRDTQIRVEISKEAVDRYHEVMIDEATRDLFPPILLFRDSKDRLWLADGHHRVTAAIRRGFKSIRAIIRPGTKADAIFEAAKANGRNGLQLGRADVRRSIKMIIRECPDHSDQVIADAVGCSHMTVRRVRESEPTLTNVKVETRVGKDGKRRPARLPKIQSLSEPETAASKEPTEVFPADTEQPLKPDERDKKVEYIILHADEETKKYLSKTGGDAQINEVYDRLMAEKASKESASPPVANPQTPLRNLYPHYVEEALTKDLVEAFSVSCVKSLPFALVRELCRDETQRISIENMVGRFVNQCIIKMEEPQFKLYLADLFGRMYGKPELADKIMKLVEEEGKNDAK